MLSQQSHRAIGPLANGLLGFLREAGEDWGGSLHFSFRVAGCRAVKGICREAADRFLFPLQMLSWALMTSVGEQHLRALELKGLWRVSPLTSLDPNSRAFSSPPGPGTP